MALYTAEIGATTGFAQGPTVRDMYRVLTKLQEAHAVEQVRAHIAAIETNGDWTRLRKVFRGHRALETGG